MWLTERPPPRSNMSTSLPHLSQYTDKDYSLVDSRPPEDPLTRASGSTDPLILSTDLDAIMTDAAVTGDHGND